ncbi:retrovirus-related pol polyprotein from transposon TNT 1-94 [Tanacetum coccineum]
MQDKKPDLSFFYVFGSLCYPTNDHEDLGKFDAKADIGIFVGYAPAKKAFRIYNRRTQIITETIHVTFDELTTMSSKQFSSGLGLQGMTPATSSTGLGSNPVSQQPFPEAAAPRVEVLVDSPMSTSIDQDAPSTMYMHQFWNSVYKHDDFYRFKIDKKKRFKLTLEVFRDIFQICLRVQDQDFDALPTKEDIVSFLRDLGHTRDITSLNDVVVNQMHQPWRTFAALINRSLSGKTSGLDKLRLSKAQII